MEMAKLIDSFFFFLSGPDVNLTEDLNIFCIFIHNLHNNNNNNNNKRIVISDLFELA